MQYIRALALLCVAAVMVLTGCGAENGQDPATPPFNRADVNFVRGMIPHHRQAIQMAQLAQGRAANPEVEQLAEQIEAAQGPEIQTMRGWLRTWDQPLKGAMGGSGSMDHGQQGSMDHESMDGMSGMMPSSDMRQLRSAEGEAFDEAFLTMMVEHHEGAIHMASVEERQGRNPTAVALAQKIQQEQAAEIEKMTGLLRG